MGLSKRFLWIQMHPKETIAAKHDAVKRFLWLLETPMGMTYRQEGYVFPRSRRDYPGNTYWQVICFQ